MYFVRTNPKGVGEKTCDADMAVGDINGSALDVFRALVSDLYLPILAEQGSWGRMPAQHTKEFLSGTSKFASVLAEAAASLEGGVELRRPDAKLAETYDLKPGSFNAAANDEEASATCEECLQDWCNQVGVRDRARMFVVCVNATCTCGLGCCLHGYPNYLGPCSIRFQLA